MIVRRIRELLPSWKNAVLAAASAGLLALAFPPFELWYAAWFAVVPLLWAVDRERSVRRSFVLGWIFGNTFFFATCWWLTYAPINYAGFPAILAYLLLLGVTSVAALFPGLFAASTSLITRRLGSVAFLAVPAIWVFSEFGRYWVTGNNWNAIGYSQAFVPQMIKRASFGGVYLISGLTLLGSALLYTRWRAAAEPRLSRVLTLLVTGLALWSAVNFFWGPDKQISDPPPAAATVIAVQPNVPMAGLTMDKWKDLRVRHVKLAEAALNGLGPVRPDVPTTVIFPESPMNFMYEDDLETKEFINGFAAKHNVSVLFNSAEPDAATDKFYNSAVLVGPEGRELAQYDKIYLLPFGEAVPFPLEAVMPGFVGTFSYGKEYDLLPFGDAKAGVMICFESHFGQLSRQYVRGGADFLIEMTNDGYLGPTAVLRQHLANAVFRAVETNRPVIRVTNVGITAYINEKGDILNAAGVYQEDTRIWSVPKADGLPAFYVKWGDWFAWLSSIFTLALVIYSVRRRHLSKI